MIKVKALRKWTMLNYLKKNTLNIWKSNLENHCMYNYTSVKYSFQYAYSPHFYYGI